MECYEVKIELIVGCVIEAFTTTHVVQWNVSYLNFRHPNTSVNRTAFQLLFSN